MSTPAETVDETAPADGATYPISTTGMVIIGTSIAVAFILVQTLGLALATETSIDLVLSNLELTSESQGVEGESGAMSAPIIVGLVLASTAMFLILIRVGFERIIQLLFLIGAYGVGLWYVLLTTGVDATALEPHAVGAVLALALWRFPTWYVVNAVAIVWGALVVGVGGMVLTPLPIIVLLALLLVWDFIAVYFSGHMTELADGISNLRTPALLVFPASPSFSLPESLDDVSEKPVMLLGTGDLVIPSLLVVSAATFSPAPVIEIGLLQLTAPAIGAAIGILVGVVAMFNLPGRVHAGLPPLNTGAVAGYVAACIFIGVPLFPA